jgi:uncharacterized phage protein (TIGR02218 family)
VRNVPTDLQAHLDQSSTTTCRLLKISSQSGVVFGLTTLDVNVAYDDGTDDGEINYIATNGFDPTAIRADLGFAVDNAEGMALLSDAVPGVTAEMVDAGEFDDGTWVCYLVNFKDLTAGRHVELGSGDLGEIRMRHGIVWIPELLDTMVRLKQPIGEVFSRRCRAIYGLPATEANRHRGCGVDISGLWTTGEVQSVGAETDRTFTGDAQATLVTTIYPSIIQFLTGDNAGREYAVEDVDTLVFNLLETTAYPIQAGDTYRHRRDCGKLYEADCIGINSNGPNFKGEPHIPDGGEVASVAA